MASRAPDGASDAAIVGGGVAGLAAATWLARYRRTVAVFDAGRARHQVTEAVHGYLGADPISPAELRQRALDGLDRYDTVQCLATEVRAVTGEAGNFVVDTGSGLWQAARVVLATGVVDDLPPVEGLAEHYGRSAFYCPGCDGYEARDRRVVAIGWSTDVCVLAASLLHWAREVTVVVPPRACRTDAASIRQIARRGVDVVEGQATALMGPRDALRGVRLDDGEVVTAEMVFFVGAHRPATALATGLGCDLDDDGLVVVDDDGQTSVGGIFAAGDLTPGLDLVQVAAAQGAIAGVGCARSLADRLGAPSPGNGAE